MRKDMRLLQAVVLEDSQQRSHMQLKANFLSNERLVAHAEADPIDSEDVKAPIQGGNNLSRDTGQQQTPKPAASQGGRDPSHCGT